MSHVKAGGSSKNNRNNAGKRLGVKVTGGQPVRTGQVIVRQNGSIKVSGDGTHISRDFTIHAGKDGTVQFQRTKKLHFTGKTVRRTEVTVT